MKLGNKAEVSSLLSSNSYAVRSVFKSNLPFICKGQSREESVPRSWSILPAEVSLNQTLTANSCGFHHLNDRRRTTQIFLPCFATGRYDRTWETNRGHTVQQTLSKWLKSASSFMQYIFPPIFFFRKFACFVDRVDSELISTFVQMVKTELKRLPPLTSPLIFFFFFKYPEGQDIWIL